MLIKISVFKKVYVLFILNKPKIKKIFKEDKINKKEIINLSLFDKTKSEI